tara:strand:+ start:2715 stop:3149 length:435 start_codon:yes stop_codon:yes gene_type:complete
MSIYNINYAISNNLQKSVGWGERDFIYSDRTREVSDNEIKIEYMGSRQGRTDKFIQANAIYLEKDKNWKYVGVVVKCVKLSPVRDTDPTSYILIIDKTQVLNNILSGTYLSTSKRESITKLGFNAIGGKGNGSVNNGAFGIIKN